jgi:nitronate monooxygenase
MAGGHGVSRGTLTLVPAVADLAGPTCRSWRRGGIADGRGLAACLMLGAAGVALGTRFYATTESRGIRTRQEAHRRQPAGTTALRSGGVRHFPQECDGPPRSPRRCLLNEHLKRWSGRELDLMRSIDEEGPRYTAHAQPVTSTPPR